MIFYCYRIDYLFLLVIHDYHVTITLRLLLIQRGKAYRIVDGTDLSLKSAEPELECVYQAGLTPSKVPEGPLYGAVLKVLVTSHFDSFINRIWWGKIATEYKCPSTGVIYHVGFNNLLNHFLNPFLVYLGRLDENDKGSLILDYTVDFSQICPGMEKFAGIKRNAFPGNIAVDGVRFVGRQKDGGAILLGKVVHQHDRTVPLSYFSFVNYDAQLNVDFAVGQSLPPL